MNQTNKNIYIEEQTLKEELKKIVLARMRTIPNDVRVSIGAKEYTREELIQHVEAEDEVGKELIQMHLGYLRDLARGAMYQDE